jgi:hypothetical protein
MESTPATIEGASLTKQQARVFNVNVQKEPVDMADLSEELRALTEQVAALQIQNYPQLMTTRQCAEFLQRTTRYLELARKERNAGKKSGPPFLHVGEKTI